MNPVIQQLYKHFLGEETTATRAGKHVLNIKTYIPITDDEWSVLMHAMTFTDKYALVPVSWTKMVKGY